MKKGVILVFYSSSTEKSGILTIQGGTEDDIAEELQNVALRMEVDFNLFLEGLVYYIIKN